ALAQSDQVGADYWKRWQSIAELFAAGNNKHDAGDIVERALKPDGVRPLIVVDLSQVPHGITRSVWDDKIKPLLIDTFLYEINQRAEWAYQQGKSLNTLVV